MDVVDKEVLVNVVVVVLDCILFVVVVGCGSVLVIARVVVVDEKIDVNDFVEV